MKYCSRCECILPLIMFSKNRCKSDGFDNYCKECKKEYNKKKGYKYNYDYDYPYWHKWDNEKYGESNKISCKRWREKNPQYQKQNYEKNKEYFLGYMKDYNKRNAEKIKAYQRKYMKTDNGRRIAAKRNSKHENKGFILLMNNPFPEEIEIEYHHIFKDKSLVIPMPRVTHRDVLDERHYKHNLEWIEKLYSLDVETLF